MKREFDVIREAWSEQTASAGTWNPECPARGQCAVTALVVQDWYGGDLLRAEIELYDEGGYKTGQRESHYWNRIPGMGELDLTREQYMPSSGRTLPLSRN